MKRKNKIKSTVNDLDKSVEISKIEQVNDRNNKQYKVLGYYSSKKIIYLRNALSNSDY